MTFTGAAEVEMWTPLQDNSAGSDYWLAAEEAAAGKARVKAAEKREAIDLGDFEYPRELKCADTRSWLYIRQALETKRKLVKFGPGEYPFGDGKQPGTMAASFGVPGSGAMKDKVTGTPKIATGTIVYHCADYARCGGGR